jgi:hypothetical protein
MNFKDLLVELASVDVALRGNSSQSLKYLLASGGFRTIGLLLLLLLLRVWWSRWRRIFLIICCIKKVWSPRDIR